VKGSFFKQRRFVDDEDLAQQLAEWHDEVNTQRPSRATGVVPAVRLAEETPRLRPLRVRPDALVLRIPIFVGATAYVRYAGQPYSMPPESIGLNGTLYLGRETVRIVAGRHEALHERRHTPGEPATLPEHRAQRVAAVSGTRARRYLKREHLLGLGGGALAYLTELVHRRPRLWIRDVDRLHDLLDRHGDDALRAAFARGLADGLFGHEYITHELATTPRLGAPQPEVAR
jgi:hypothetical protein